MASPYDTNPYSVKAPVQKQDAGFDASPIGQAWNFFSAVPETTYDTGKKLVQSLFRIPAEFGISAGQAGAAIADKLLGTKYLDKAIQPVASDGLSAFLGSEPLKGYAPQIEEFAKSIEGSSFAKSTGLDKHAMPLAFAGIVGMNAINFDTGGAGDDIIKAIAKETDPARIFRMLTDSGVEKSMAAKAANHLAETSSTAEVKATLDTLRGLQSVHDATSPATPIAEQIQEQFPHIESPAAQDIASNALAKTDKSPAAVESFVQKAIDEYKPPKLTKESAAPGPITHAQIDELVRRTKSATTESDLQDVKTQIQFYEDALQSMPGRDLVKYVSKTTGDLPELTGKDTMKSLTGSGKDVKTSKFGVKGDQIVQEVLGSGDSYSTAPSMEDAQKALDQYREARKSLDSLKEQAIDLRKDLDAKAKAERLAGLITKKTTDARAAQEAAVQESMVRAAGTREKGKPVEVAQGEPIKSVGDIIANGKRIPIERTPGNGLARLQEGTDAGSWKSLVKGYIAEAKPGVKAHIFTYMGTPEFELERLGLARGAEMLQDAKDTARKTLKAEITKIMAWQEEANGPYSARLIFQYLDGQEKAVFKDMSDIEVKVAQEIRVYLKEWATRLGLPEENQISRYITHIFERGVAGKDNEAFIDPDLAAIMAEHPAKSVYNPFLEKRLGGQNYIEDVWRALDAYVKRASRKEAMDPALEQIARDASNLDEYSYRYVTTMTHRINMRPTEIEKGMDNFIKQTPIGHYFTDRPTAFLSKAIRQVFYRGTLGLNFSSALRNLTQGANTYAKLGEKYTVIGYSRLFSKMVSRDLEELFTEGVIDENILQDRQVGVIKQGVQKLDKGLFSLFQMAELINRGSAYYGAKSMYYAENSHWLDGIQVLKSGASEEQAVKFAKRIVRETQFAFGAVDTPVAMNDDLTKTLLQLQTYNIKQAEFLKRMFQQRDFVGLLRWTGASFAMVYTIGRLFGMTPQQLIPTIGIGGAPITSAAVGLSEYMSSNPQTHAQGVSQLQRSVAAVIPGGAQLRKTGQAIIDLQRGKDVTATGKFRYRVDPQDAVRALIFGPNALPQAKKYFDGLPKVNPVTGESSKKQKTGANPYNI